MERWLDRWRKLPEVVRWVLLLPAVLVCWLGINLVQSAILWVGQWLRFVTPFWAMVSGAFISAGVLFPLVFALAPSAQRIVGWLFYVPVMVLNGFSLLLMVARRLATWGLLGNRLLPPPGEVWTTRDWGELAQAAVWLVFGTYVFRHCLRQYPSRRSPLPAAAPAVQP